MIICTIAYLTYAVNCRQRKTESLPAMIVTQLLLLLISYSIYIWRDWSYLANDAYLSQEFNEFEGKWHRKLCILADYLFGVQHNIYLAQYVWVSYLIPITFCEQTPEIKYKRKTYGCVIITIALLIAPIFVSFSVLNL